MKMRSFLIAVCGVALIPGAALAHDAPSANSSNASAVVPRIGQMIYWSKGALAPVYRMAPDGSPQIIIDGKMVTVPPTTITENNGKVETSLSRRDLMTSS